MKQIIKTIKNAAIVILIFVLLLFITAFVFKLISRGIIYDGSIVASSVVNL
ncbi:MAG: hypothetical protein ABIL18_07655 [candidate division WOR-3 bacterium]